MNYLILLITLLIRLHLLVVKVSCVPVDYISDSLTNQKSIAHDSLLYMSDRRLTISQHC